MKAGQLPSDGFLWAQGAQISKSRPRGFVPQSFAAVSPRPLRAEKTAQGQQERLASPHGPEGFAGIASECRKRGASRPATPPRWRYRHDWLLLTRQVLASQAGLSVDPKRAQKACKPQAG